MNRKIFIAIGAALLGVGCIAAITTTVLPSINYTPSTGAVAVPAGSPYNFPATTKIGSVTAAPLTGRVSTQFDKTTSTSLADVPGLSVPVVAGKTYSFRARLFFSLDATGSGKIALGGTCTATDVRAYFQGLNPADITSLYNLDIIIALASAKVFSSPGVNTATIEGTITVNAGGTLTVRFAQNSGSGTSSVLVGSTFEVREFP